MFNKNVTYDVVRYLEKNNFILDNNDMLLLKSLYYKFPITVTILNDGKINIKDSINNRRYNFDINNQSHIVITQFINYLETSTNILLS